RACPLPSRHGDRRARQGPGGWRSRPQSVRSHSRGPGRRACAPHGDRVTELIVHRHCRKSAGGPKGAPSHTKKTLGGKLWISLRFSSLDQREAGDPRPPVPAWSRESRSFVPTREVFARAKTGSGIDLSPHSTAPIDTTTYL